MIDSAQDDSIASGFFKTSATESVARFLHIEIHNLKVQLQFFGCALHIASVFGDEDVVRILLEKGLDPHKRIPLLDTVLKAAINGHNTEIVRILLNTGVEVDATGASLRINDAPLKPGRISRNPFFWSGLETYYYLSTALTLAAREGSCEIIELLLKHGAAINLLDANGTTALFAAVEADKEEAVKLLVDKGADVDLPMKGNSKGTAITEAFERGSPFYPKVVPLLLNKVSNLNQHDYHELRFRSLLHRACYLHDETTVKLLLEKNADVNAKDSMGAAPIHTVLDNKRLSTDRAAEKILTILLDNGADVNAIGANGLMAIHYINCRHNWENLLRVLMVKGANINAKAAGSNDTPLHCAVKFRVNPSLELVHRLIEYGADINACDVMGMTALNFAAGSDPISLPLVQLLLENGASADEYMNTPHGLLAQSNDKKVVRFISEWTRCNGFSPTIVRRNMINRAAVEV